MSCEYQAVANEPEKGFHFHTGRPLARILGYDDDWLEGIPEPCIESFAGTGNPFSLGEIKPGEQVVDIGCGAGFDSLLAARQVGPGGRVIAVDMTEAMLDKTRAGAEALGLENVDPRLGYAEELPVADGEVDVVISNGVINLTPDKVATLREIARALKPGGRLQIACRYAAAELQDGASIACDGCCLTIVGAHDDGSGSATFDVDASNETIERTTIQS